MTKQLFKENKGKKNTRSLFVSNSNLLSISTFMQNMKRFLKLFSWVRSRNQITFSKITREAHVTLKELTYRPVCFSNSNISFTSTCMQHMKRFLNVFSKIKAETKNAFPRTTKGNNSKGIYSSACISYSSNISSISKFMQIIKRFL